MVNSVNTSARSVRSAHVRTAINTTPIMWRGGLCHMIYVRMRMDSQCFLFPIQILDFRFSFCHSFWLLPNAESDFGGASRLAWIHGEDLYKRERSGRTRDIREMVRLRPGRPPPYERSARIAMIRSHGAWARASCMPPPCEPWHEPLCPQAQHAMSHVHRNARRVIARHRASSRVIAEGPRQPRLQPALLYVPRLTPLPTARRGGTGWCPASRDSRPHSSPRARLEASQAQPRRSLPATLTRDEAGGRSDQG